MRGGPELPCPSIGALNTIGARVFFDADQDGDVDALVVSPTVSWSAGTTYRVLINTGGTLAVSQTLVPPAPSFAQALAAGDLDGDGDLDVVGGFGIVFKNAGGGSFQVMPAVTTVPLPHVVLADLDGDGDLDAVRSRASSSSTTAVARSRSCR